MEITKIYGNSRNRQVLDVRKALVKLIKAHKDLKITYSHGQ